VRVIAVEKPGVAFLDNPQPPGAGDPCSDEFKIHHTPPEWSAALSAALRESLRQPGIDPSRVLVLGHSEGADMAAYVAQANPDIVTHVACLAGAGITQLFDMTQLAWAEQVPGEDMDRRSQRVQAVYNTWADIQRDPAAIDKSAWGHPYKRWSNFAAISPVENLLATDPRQQLFLAHGTADQAVPIASFDAGLAILASKGRTAVVRRLPGLDHGFAASDDASGEGITRIMGDAVRWFLKNEPTAPDAPLLAPQP
jgi:pimeloyl-ACP methyl ester carboxylesterase